MSTHKHKLEFALLLVLHFHPDKTSSHDIELSREAQDLMKIVCVCILYTLHKGITTSPLS